MSTNAPAVPALMLQRQRSAPFESPWLSWIGPWSLTTYLGELDDPRTIEGAKLFGLRLAFRPHTLFEVSLERSAMLGGSGRKFDLKTFWNMFIGKDNGYGEQGGTTVGNISKEEEPGNQLATMGARIRFPFHIPLAYYYQRMTEDATANPTEWNYPTYLHGLEYWDSLGPYRLRAHYESTDTLAESEMRWANVVYNHGTYQTGYRYEGLSIGHPSDNDSLTQSVGLLLQTPDNSQWQVTLFRAHINRDGANGSAVNSRSAVEAHQRQLSINYQDQFGDYRVRVGLHHATLRPQIIDGYRRESLLHLQINRPF